jgi:LysR family nitrogen assimilation transcriptional regulator
VELRQLKYFARIVELGSLSKAANDLRIAQPALSRQIGALERELKTPLLTRSVRGTAATEAGAELYRHAQSVLRQLDAMSDAVQNASRSVSGVVTIGIPTSTANILAVPLVREVHAKLPNVQLHITEGESGYLEELLASGRLETSLLYERQQRPQKLHVRPLLAEDLFLVSSATGSTAPHEVTLAQLARYPLVLPSLLSTTRQLLEAALAKAGLSANVVVDIDATTTMKSLVHAGIGSAILSRAALSAEHDAKLSVRRIVRPALSRELCLCTSRTAPLTRGAQAVVELIEATARKLVRDGTWRNVTELPATV